ncbi:MAG: Mur ligase family protein, partial [Bacteroidota bacterium]
MMNQLSDILNQVRLLASRGDMSVTVSSIAFDSRHVQRGGMFIAVKGTRHDGHAFIDQVIAAGVSVIVAETEPDPSTDVVWITVQDSAQALGVIASNYFGNPASQLKLTGVTGTNGKTTVDTLLFKLFSALGSRCGMLSTVVNRIVDNVIPSTHTTPDPIQLNALLAQMVEAGCTHCFMEVSSHAVDQGRIAGLQFAGGVFT